MHAEEFDMEAAQADLEAVRLKYREERNRRVRPEGEGQYLEAVGRFADYMDTDPYVDVPLERDPRTRSAPVLVIGGGWGGLIAGARLHQAGVEFLIVDDAGDFGGTWYWNRYPGAQCDVDSYCYMPLLEETGYMPSQKYTYAPELFEHAQRIGRTFDLYRRTLFQTRVTEMRWDAAASRWQVRTNHDDRLTVQFVVLAPGPTSRGKLPGIPGIEDFKGNTFHTLRWDYDYTGGDSTGGLDGLKDKRVAIIGTGATAIQCVPHLGAAAKELYVFQRTPSSVGVRGNKPTDPEWAATLEPGWQQKRQENFDDVFVGKAVDDEINDNLTAVFRGLAPRVGPEASPEERELLAELEDMRMMNQARDHVDRVVLDPAKAAALKPWYRIMCKRPTFHDDFLQTFNRPSVKLIDTSGSRGVERMTEDALVVDGIEYPVDCVIFATGFEQSGNWRRRLGEMTIEGEDGKSLYDHWSMGMRTFFGTMVRGFPNFFYSGPGQTGASFNYTTMADAPANLVAHIVRRALDEGIQAVQPSVETEEEFVRLVRSHSTNNVKFQQACTPGYYNAEGRIDQAFKYDVYAPGQNAFRRMMDEWMADGGMRGLSID